MKHSLMSAVFIMMILVVSAGVSAQHCIDYNTITAIKTESGIRASFDEFDDIGHGLLLGQIHGESFRFLRVNANGSIEPLLTWATPNDIADVAWDGSHIFYSEPGVGIKVLSYSDTTPPALVATHVMDPAPLKLGAGNGMLLVDEALYDVSNIDDWVMIDEMFLEGGPGIVEWEYGILSYSVSDLHVPACRRRFYYDMTVTPPRFLYGGTQSCGGEWGYSTVIDVALGNGVAAVASKTITNGDYYEDSTLSYSVSIIDPLSGQRWYSSAPGWVDRIVDVLPGRCLVDFGSHVRWLEMREAQDLVWSESFSGLYSGPKVLSDGVLLYIDNQDQIVSLSNFDAEMDLIAGSMTWREMRPSFVSEHYVFGTPYATGSAKAFEIAEDGSFEQIDSGPFSWFGATPYGAGDGWIFKSNGNQFGIREMADSFQTHWLQEGDSGRGAATDQYVGYFVDGDFIAYDVRDPREPRLISITPMSTGDGSRTVVSSGAMFYVVESSSDLPFHCIVHSLSVDSEYGAVIVQTLVLDGARTGARVMGPVLTIPGASGSLPDQNFVIGDDGLLQPIDPLPYPWTYDDAVYYDGLVYVVPSYYSEPWPGLYVYDVTDIEHPVEAAHLLSVPGVLAGVSNGYLVAGSVRGMHSVPLHCPTTVANEDNPIDDDTVLLPQSPLGMPSPNPFNPQTLIEFRVDIPGHAELIVFDGRGRKVRTLINDMVATGTISRDWNGTNDAGRTLPAGIYMVQLRLGDETWSRKITLLK